MARAFLFVLDSVGIGGAADAAAFGDEGSNTVLHIAEACSRGSANLGREHKLTIPNLARLGMGAACELSCGTRPPGLIAAGFGAWGVGAPAAPGKDTITGHWELAGVPLEKDWCYFPKTEPSFPADLIAALIAQAGLPGILGDKHASGTAILDELGEESIRTGKPICYTSADSVFQIAAHEKHFGLTRLLEVCEIARKLVDPLGIGRVIARPFLGEKPGAFKRTANRHDYAVPPPAPTIGDRVQDAGGHVTGIGKIEDIFAGHGISESRKGRNDMALMNQAILAMEEAEDGDLVFANFVEFDSLYGHRRDVAGYARALEAFDAKLPEMLDKMRRGDVLILTADHGNDPTWTGTDHTRENVPILCAGPDLIRGTFGTRAFVDVAETVAVILGLPAGPHGTSFLEPVEGGGFRPAAPDAPSKDA
ncbi:MAG: phosphopentomutase [Paracoccaceae bacterium]|jgi:phosphopentomutase